MLLRRLLPLVLSIAVTLALLSLFLWINRFSPLEVGQTIIRSTWGSPTGILLVFTRATLLILTGLAVVIPYRAGLFNIGGEGQMYVGALSAAVVGALPFAFIGPLHLLLCLAIGTVIGALWGALAAVLKTWRGIHEVISTIMLNFIAFQLVNELTYGMLSGGQGTSRTALIHESAKMPLLLSFGAAETSGGIVVAVGIAVVLTFALYRTWFGFHLRAVGSNPKTARFSGIGIGKIHLSSLLLGGGCAGLAGALETTGISHTFFSRFVASYGFDGIAVAFLALCEPLATIPAALVIATLRASDRALQLDLDVPKELVLVLEGILIICVAISMRRRNHV
ncbi:MAG: ABC transporter permease [Candidatus Omnitrophota bacterium]|jgi:simple sugar transport system permease protein|nr:MAG: ABC transporter permease [Candidatus Omnitrophota bacterium]